MDLWQLLRGYLSRCQAGGCLVDLWQRSRGYIAVLLCDAFSARGISV